MKVFHCDRCQQLIFFENVQCVKCKSALAFVPDKLDLQSLEAAEENLWKPAVGDTARRYRLCDNYAKEGICNWAVLSDDPNPLCQSCRLTHVIPDIDQPERKEAWFRLEIAKRRLVYSLLYLNLPVVSRVDDPQRGLSFEFLADGMSPSGLGNARQPVLTGHSDGVITINVAEADDAEREKRRMELREPYRTLLGHFRHEVGHYYWNRLILDTAGIDAFRALFGDERADYAQALQNYYAQGAPADWQQRFVTAYASSHPWEDWAETWAHYLHMIDTLETAVECGLSLRPARKDEPALTTGPKHLPGLFSSFDQMIDAWLSLTYVLNNLNRGMGLPDGYPFILSTSAVDKLRFVHRVVGQEKQEAAAISPGK